MSSNEGRQSPPPEEQSGRQGNEAPASGKGTDNVDSGNKKGDMQDQLKNLSSNPKGVLEDEVKAKFTKTTEAESRE